MLWYPWVKCVCPEFIFNSSRAINLMCVLWIVPINNVVWLDTGYFYEITPSILDVEATFACVSKHILCKGGNLHILYWRQRFNRIRKWFERKSINQEMATKTETVVDESSTISNQNDQLEVAVHQRDSSKVENCKSYLNRLLSKLSCVQICPVIDFKICSCLYFLRDRIIFFFSIFLLPQNNIATNSEIKRLPLTNCQLLQFLDYWCWFVFLVIFCELLF